MEMQEFLRSALKNVGKKLAKGVLDKHEEGYDDEEEMLLDWIWIELKEVSPDKDAVINMDLDDVYELLESSAELYDDYQLLLDSVKDKDA
ncbi:MAG TPA: hypothetical protein DCE18_13885 [Syntrophobacteraceae bacterium]|nr:hypothetical protein [Syntrophobacteraceae bacterium]HBZ54619.1 hypothetical protein [Syntrophobacteraceae bacterium]